MDNGSAYLLFGLILLFIASVIFSIIKNVMKYKAYKKFMNDNKKEK